jgi:hypothetical protein
MYTLSATFPFELFDIIDQFAVMDPYVSKYIHTTIALGNSTHKMFLNGPTEARVDEAIACANQFAARCFPFGGGMDGIVSAMLSQLARTGASCVEWAPSRDFSRVERGYLVPVKTLRFQYADDIGSIKLVQVDQANALKLVDLNPVQVSYHGLYIRDTNPYPIPPVLAALEACATHRQIMGQVKTWMDKVSALGVMLCEVTPPPREPGEKQADYDIKSQTYLNKIADAVEQNLNSGLGVGYNNQKFVFQSTQSGAQGAKDILQLVLQGMFSALERDGIFFGWSFNPSETLARVVYEEMLRGIRLYQQGVKRALEHGHRLNLALNGFGDIEMHIKFDDNLKLDAFKEAESHQMDAQAVSTMKESGFIDIAEGRKILGLEEKTVEAGSFVAAFNTQGHYVKQPYIVKNRPVDGGINAG